MAAMVSCFLGKARLLVQAAWQASAETITPAEIASHPRAPNVVPALIADLGDEAAWRYVEFFTANIRNPHTRRAYARACARFFAWCQDRGHADGDPPELRDLRDRALIATLLIREGSATARRRSAATPSGRPASPSTSLTVAPSSTRKKWLRTKARYDRTKEQPTQIPKLGQYETTAFGRRAAQRRAGGCGLPRPG